MRLQRLNKWFRRVIFLFAGIFAAYIALCFYMAEEVLSPKRVLPPRPQELVELEINNAPAWASPSVKSGKAKTVFIFSHGLMAQQDFFAKVAIQVAKKGFGVVLPPMPGQGYSPLQRVGFGLTESDVIQQTIDKIKADKIILVGCSMGGAATWLASKHPRVSAVVTEGAYGRLDPVTRYWFERKTPGGSILFRPVIWIASWKMGMNPANVNPVETAAKFTKPALVIQCEKDGLIPREQAEELAKVSNADYWLIPGKKHAQGQEVGDEYIRRLIQVAEKVSDKA
jgi:pimeloyl-ACP methyl ester carboxylesterase